MKRTTGDWLFILFVALALSVILLGQNKNNYYYLFGTLPLIIFCIITKFGTTLKKGEK